MESIEETSQWLDKLHLWKLTTIFSCVIHSSSICISDGLIAPERRYIIKIFLHRCKTSMKRLVVLTAASYGKLNDTGPNEPLMPGTPAVPVRGVNVMLGGVMLSAIILVIFVLCYCCHKSNRKSPSSSPPSTYWRDPGLSMEIYTVDTQSCIEYEEYSSESRRPSSPGPPPPYELVVPSTKFEGHQLLQLPENAEPPTYEKACELHKEMQITAQGYV